MTTTPTITKRFCFIVLLLLALTASVARTGAKSPAQQPSSTSGLAPLSVVKPATACAALASADVSAAVGSATHITAAAEDADGKPAPYCRVTGYVEPMVKFEVRLPLATWTQRFVQTGCGGLCGNLNIRLGNSDGCYPADHGELALASTDMGHSGGIDGEFGEKEYQLRIDFAYRGVHVTTLAAKALIAAFYGQNAKFSYFAGCSDGGREALMEAERYPQDFNGITAGAPAMNFTTQNTFYHGWNALKNTGPDGKPILTAGRLPILHQAALQACDAADGLKDGLIGDPLSCKFDPTTAECKEGQNPSRCLSHAEAEAARSIYAGAHDSQGHKLVLSGPLPGSELAWAGVYVPAPGNDRIFSSAIATGTLKYLAYQNDPPSTYTLQDLQFTPESFTATTALHGLYDATDPDLRPFAKAGGKLILWHGLADPHISPLNTLAYYTAMNRLMGDKAVQQFTRVYLFPGGYHCAGGEGPFNFDVLGAVMAWVEGGKAPVALLASHQASAPQLGGDAAPNGSASASRAAPRVDRTRPVYPYPLTTKYDGTGSVDDAANFSAGPANPVSPAQLQWLGSSFYAPGYELWCQGKGAAMTCTSKP